MAPAGAALALLAMWLTACSMNGTPMEGEYIGELCVTNAKQPVNCGPVQARLGRDVAQIEVSDIGYQLFFKKDSLDLVLMHGAMRIDSFSAPYVWKGPVLTFSDPDKPVHYQIRFENAPAGKRAQQP